MRAWFRGLHRLDLKVSVLVAVVLGGLGLLQLAGLVALNLFSFMRVEQLSSAEDLARIGKALEDEERRLLEVTREYAAWDDTRAFMLGDYPDFVRDNFSQTWLAELGMDIIVIADLSGRPVWQWRIGDTVAYARLDGSTPVVPALVGLPTMQAAAAWDIGRQGLFLVAAWPIRDNSNTAPPAGWLVMGRYYTGRLDDSLAQSTGLKTQATQHTIFDDHTPGQSPDTATTETWTDGAFRYFRIPVSNLNGATVGHLNLSRDRPLRPVFIYSTAVVLAISALMVSLTILTLRHALRHHIVRPLEIMADYLQARASGMSSSLPLNLGKAEGRLDELGTVADRMDWLMDVVKQREQMLELSKLRLEEEASIDPLTGLANRRRFDEHLNHELRRLARLHRQLEPEFMTAIMLCDLDHFKLYNDRFGHPAGDECLKTVAQTIDRNLHRPGDLACRYGGEEFIVVLPATTLEGAVQVARNIQADLAAQALPHPDSPVSDLVTLSIGIAVTNACENSEILERTVSLADRALYKAKRGGRNRIEYAPVAECDDSAP